MINSYTEQSSTIDGIRKYRYLQDFKNVSRKKTNKNYSWIFKEQELIELQWKFNGSNIDGSFTTAVSNSFLGWLVVLDLMALLDNMSDYIGPSFLGPLE